MLRVAHLHKANTPPFPTQSERHFHFASERHMDCACLWNNFSLGIVLSMLVATHFWRQCSRFSLLIQKSNSESIIIDERISSKKTKFLESTPAISVVFFSIFISIHFPNYSIDEMKWVEIRFGEIRYKSKTHEVDSSARSVLFVWMNIMWLLKW